MDRKFPTDAEIEQKVADHNIDNLIGILLQSKTISYEGRKRLASVIAQMRGHIFKRDNFQPIPNGTEGKCDQCGMDLLIPEHPKQEEAHVRGRAVELNCPNSRRKGEMAKSYADMPLHMYEQFLIRLKK